MILQPRWAISFTTSSAHLGEGITPQATLRIVTSCIPVQILGTRRPKDGRTRHGKKRSWKMGSKRPKCNQSSSSIHKNRLIFGVGLSAVSIYGKQRKTQITNPTNQGFPYNDYILLWRWTMHEFPSMERQMKHWKLMNKLCQVRSVKTSSPRDTIAHVGTKGDFSPSRLFRIRWRGVCLRRRFADGRGLRHHGCDFGFALGHLHCICGVILAWWKQPLLFRCWH